MRALGVDLGGRRIGIATCDRGEVLASALTVIERSGTLHIDHQRLAALAVEEEVECVVVGVPIALDGTYGIAAQAVLEEIAELATVIGVPVETIDERLTTAAAHKDLAAQGISSKKRRSRIDAVAAANILQGWLDARRSQQPTRGMPS